MTSEQKSNSASRMFIPAHKIFNQTQYEKLVRQPDRDKSNSNKQNETESSNGDNSKEFIQQMRISEEFSVNITCNECKSKSINETFDEYVAINLSLPRCRLNHNADNDDYSAFERFLIEKQDKK